MRRFLYISELKLQIELDSLCPCIRRGIARSASARFLKTRAEQAEHFRTTCDETVNGPTENNEEGSDATRPEVKGDTEARDIRQETEESVHE